MIGSILLAVIGMEVYPNYANWWIAYAAFMSCFRLVQFIISTLKLVAEFR